MWWLSGITRCYLEARPKLQIADHFARCTLLPSQNNQTEGKRGGCLALDVVVESLCEYQCHICCEVELIRDDGESIFRQDIGGCCRKVGLNMWRDNLVGCTSNTPVEPWSANYSFVYT